MSVLVQVNRKSIVKTLSMGLICELDLAQAKGKEEREKTKLKRGIAKTAL